MATVYADSIICTDCHLATIDFDDLGNLAHWAAMKRHLSNGGFPIGDRVNIISTHVEYPFDATDCDGCGTSVAGERWAATIIID